MLHHDPMCLLLGYVPCGPTDQPVNCVATLRLVQRKLMMLAVEFINPPSSSRFGHGVST